MREITGNKEFDYILLCNKICGVAHFNMKMNVVCESQDKFETWMKGQKSVAQTLMAPGATADLGAK